jgi:hypothetical protein
MQVKLLFTSLLAVVLLVISARTSKAAVLIESTDSLSPEQWTERELERFVESAFKEQLSVPQVEKIWNRLDERQKQEVGVLLALKAGTQPHHWLEFVRRESLQSRLAIIKEASLAIQGELWRQYIENIWTWAYPPGTTFASSYWNSPLCDNDPSDPDWVFWFWQPYEWYSRNPDGLRWTTTSARVYLTFMAAYGGNLNGYAYSWQEARLCLGTTAVDVAGGPDYVKQTTFLSPNH